MSWRFCVRRPAWLPAGVVLLLNISLLLCLSNAGYALCGLYDAGLEQVRTVKDPRAARQWSRTLGQGQSSCILCHERGMSGPRNAYGNAINVLLRGDAYFDKAQQRQAGYRVNDIPAYLAYTDSPTFGEMIEQGRLPAPVSATDPPPFRTVRAEPVEPVTVERARELVKKVQAASPFGKLQISRLETLSPEAAAELATFRGQMLILGLPSLSPEVARALAGGQAATVWLHSVTSVTPEAADAIVKLRGHLVLSGLVKLDSVPLAVKLAQRPAPLALPYLQQITPEIAQALSQAQNGLTLSGLRTPALEVQEALAQTVGSLYLPNLQSLDSLALTKKLASGRNIVLPALERMSLEHAQVLAGNNRLLYGGIVLSVAAMRPEIAEEFVKRSTIKTVGLSLAGAGPLDDAALSTLLQARVPLELQDVESLTTTQLQVIAAANGNNVRSVSFSSTLSLPRLRTLDSALLAVTLIQRGVRLGGIREISPEAAAALGALPERDGEALSFTQLDTLDPATARGLLARRWASIALPSLREVTPETLRLLVRQSPVLSLGLTDLSPEAAAIFADMASNEKLAGGGTLAFTSLRNCTPLAARALVRALNRGRSPQLSLNCRSLPLSPALAAELAQYQGRLSLTELRQFTPETAAALAKYAGPSLGISGPAVDRPTPVVGAALSLVAGNLEMEVRELNSLPLMNKLGRRFNEYRFDRVEAIADDVRDAVINEPYLIILRSLARLDSPALARRLVENNQAVVLESLRAITPEAAEVVATNAKQVILGFTILDSDAVARELARPKKSIKLNKLRAATPEVLAILKQSPWIETPPLESIFILAQQ